MSHDCHEAQPGYSPAQVLHDGCRECAYRASCRDRGIACLDPASFALAWRRAADWNRMGGGLDDVSEAEAPLLSVLWSVQLQLEVLGWPIGELPRSPMEALLAPLRRCAGCEEEPPGHTASCKARPGAAPAAAIAPEATS